MNPVGDPGQTEQAKRAAPRVDHPAKRSDRLLRLGYGPLAESRDGFKTRS